MEKYLDLPSAGVHLFLAPRGVRKELMLAFSVRFALLDDLRVIDGASVFNALDLARELRRLTQRYHEPLKRVSISRAFTCFQMGKMLCQITADRQQPSGLTPLLVLEPLNTFYDENIDLSERRRLLEKSLSHLRALSVGMPIIVSDQLDENEFVEMLVSAADQVWQFEAPHQSNQLRMF